MKLHQESSSATLMAAYIRCGVHKGEEESRKHGTLNVSAKAFEVKDPEVAVAMSYYNALNGNAPSAGIFAKRALELCNVDKDEVESLEELSRWSPAYASYNLFKRAASQIDKMARKNFFDQVRRIEEPFQTD